jgi:hypothetical protein
MGASAPPWQYYAAPVALMAFSALFVSLLIAQVVYIWVGAKAWLMTYNIKVTVSFSALIIAALPTTAWESGLSLGL